jgi:hypothetical protein
LSQMFSIEWYYFLKIRFCLKWDFSRSQSSKRTTFLQFAITNCGMNVWCVCVCWCWFSLLQMAELYNTPNLKRFCLNFIIKPENFDKVIKTEAFTRLDKELILEVLRSRPTTPPSPKPLIRRPQSGGSNFSSSTTNTNNTNIWLLSQLRTTS